MSPSLASQLSCAIACLLLLPTIKGWMEEGYTDGIDNSRYLYWQDEPTANDEIEAKKGAEDIKCIVCEVILGDLLSKLGALTDEDTILTLLEGEASETEIQAAIQQRNKNLVSFARGQKGCNRHFKDSFLRLGWDVEGCKIDPPPDAEGKIPDVPPFKQVYGLCTKENQPVQNETKMATYSLRMEAMYWACQLTIGQHSESLAKFLAKGIKNYPAPEGYAPIVKAACKQKAKCQQIKFQGSYYDREKAVERRYFAQQQDVLESVKASEKQRKREAKKEAKRAKQAAKKVGKGKKADVHAEAVKDKKEL